jgi:hypothetical protein
MEIRITPSRSAKLIWRRYTVHLKGRLARITHMILKVTERLQSVRKGLPSSILATSPGPFEVDPPVSTLTPKYID